MSDLPDFTNYSQVDLVQQTIAFLTNRPMYGEAKLVFGDKTYDPHTGAAMVKITGKGKLYAGIIYLDTDHSAKTDTVNMYIDSGQIFTAKWETFMKYNVTRLNDFIAWLSCYDEVNYKYMLNLMGDITFEESLQIGYFNDSDYSVMVSYNLIYTLLNV